MSVGDAKAQRPVEVGRRLNVGPVIGILLGVDPEGDGRADRGRLDAGGHSGGGVAELLHDPGDAARPARGRQQQLPFPQASFDATLSTVGVMFAPDQERAAAELVRVTRAGGKIALASWTPEGLVGVLFKTIGKYAPPPAGVKSPMLWGTEARLAELFGDTVGWTVTRRTLDLAYRSPEHFSEWFRLYYGPITRLAGSLDDDTRALFGADLADVPRQFNRAGDGTVLAPGEYLEAVGVRR